MKTIIALAFLVSSLLVGASAVAECTSNRNVNVIVTKPDNIYIDHGDGTVTDRETGLMWQKCPLGLSGNGCTTGVRQLLNWQDALAAANDNADFGHSDWRLPNKNEMASLLEDACINPAINQSVFPNTDFVIGPGGRHWTSSPRASVHNTAWTILFTDGFVSWDAKNTPLNVRLVRDSQ